MAHRHNSSQGSTESGPGNVQSQALLAEQLHHQQNSNYIRQQLQYQQQQSRLQSPLKRDIPQSLKHIPASRPNHLQMDTNQSASRTLLPYSEAHQWAHANNAAPIQVQHQSLPQQHSELIIRERDTEINRGWQQRDKEAAAAQVQKHFEDSFRYVNMKNGQTASTAPLPFPPRPTTGRVKVSSPAPAQIYGKPTIQGSGLPVPFGHDVEACQSPLSLTSKTPTSPFKSATNLSSHGGSASELTNSYSNSTQHQPLTPIFALQEEYQTQPLDLGGKRTLAFSSNQQMETDMNSGQGPVSATEGLGTLKTQISNQVLNLVKSENEEVMAEERIRANGKEPSPETTGNITNEDPSHPQLHDVKEESLLKEETETASLGNESTCEMMVESDVADPSSANGKLGGNALLEGVHKGKKVFLLRHSGQDAIPDMSAVVDVDKTKNGPKAGSALRDQSPDITVPPVRNGASSARKRRSPERGSPKGPEALRVTQPSTDASDEENVKHPPKRRRQKPIRVLQESGSEGSESESESDKGSCHTSDSASKKSNSEKKHRGRKPHDESGLNTSKLFKRANPFKRPAISLLKKTGQSFLQDGSCLEVAPKLGKCRECRISGSNSRQRANIFCRFYAFRKLRYTKNGTLAMAGFSDPKNDPTKEDLDLWLPSKEVPPASLDMDLAKFLLDQLGDQFCELVQQEKGAREVSISEEEEDDFVAWKRVVQGVREMCDVCDTTLFNFHWACKKCGFVVCISCYRGRIQRPLKNSGKKGKDRDEFHWLFCSSNRQPHEVENLMLTQTIAGDALTVLSKLLHRIRAVWNISQGCGCEEAKRHSEPDNAEVPTDSEIAMESQEAKKQILLEESDEDEEGFSDLAALLIPSGNNGVGKSEASKTTLPPRTDSIGSKVEPTLKHYVRRPCLNGHIRPSKVTPNTFRQSNTQQEYPSVPHSWLSYGKLLRLHDPAEALNQNLFRDVWSRGQPVLVSNVAEKLTKDLWSPEAFLQDFSDLKNDLVNCMTGRILANQPMKKFWEGFEYVEKRLKDEKGNPMLLKLKDWPPGEDFAESLPSRFLDLMNCLPLKDYTQRNGRLNLASRLPTNFVRPDLGPKMYIAYGSGVHLEKGTTNLHLDISDAVNLMVYVGVPKDVNCDEDKKVVLAAIEESDVDGPTVDRVRDGELPGALWHIYNFNDADKIRDLLNKVAVERGKKLEADHDPIHDQNWYLDKSLRDRLALEYDTMGYPMVQFEGDAVFIPAGAPHQVRNLHNCIKIAEDFVSPENVSHCFKLTEEFRELTETHSNHEDKLQIKNIIYHAVKDAVSVLYQNMDESQRATVEGTKPPHDWLATSNEKENSSQQ